MRKPLFVFACLMLIASVPNVSMSGEIHRAARKGNVERIDQLISEMVSVDAKDGDNQTPLFIALKFGRLALVKYLISKGADITIVGGGADGSQGNALHVAVLWGHLEVVKTLLTAGADSDFDDPVMGTPLHIALARGHEQIAVLIRSKGTTIRTAKSITHLIKTADIEQGRKFAIGCKYCHLLDPVSDGKIHRGPTLWNIVGRHISNEAFEYSEALLNFGGKWNFDNLNSYIKNPSRLSDLTSVWEHFAGNHVFLDLSSENGGRTSARE